MKRVPQASTKYPTVFEDGAQAGEYAARHARMARKVAGRFAATLQMPSIARC